MPAPYSKAPLDVEEVALAELRWMQADMGNALSYQLLSWGWKDGPETPTPPPPIVVKHRIRRRLEAMRSAPRPNLP